ncbi:hypothetical protein [Micromonospora sp. NPDC050695]|uniref:hypothetical protein n=1 Tax=Micromonospora sp. NPDC050695 TaxID=3154938 RepID=UPI003409EDC7
MTSGDKPTYTPHRPIRVEHELWDLFGKVAGSRNRSTVIRDFIAWYVRKPGAGLPLRPPRRTQSPAPDADD